MKKLLLILSLMLPFALNAQISGENIDATHYEIHVGDFDFANHTMSGETFVTFTATSNVQQVVLELKSLEVSSITATGTTVSDFSQNDDFLTINLAAPLAAGSSATLDIVYGGSTFSETWGGVEWWGDYVYNLGVGFDSQPHNLGKTWFPCVDNFIDKATYDVYVTTTNDKKAICGGNFVETINNGDGTSTWHWNTPQEISTYHISFAIGNYELWEDVYHGIERDIPIEVYAKPGQMNSVPGTFVHIQEICSTLENTLGPYPFNRIGYVSTGKGCMEHTDNIALAASIIDGTTIGESYLAHELSHMWSGNKVTCAEAGDMWLNEGFAQFWGIFYQTGVYGEQPFQEEISALGNTIANWCNKSVNWMPLNNIPLDMTYDTKAVYERGAVIVNTMMNYMGRENFLEAMRQYFDQYAYQTATSENLRDALTQYSDIDMNGFFDTYVFSSGMPHLYAAIKSVEFGGGITYEVELDLRYQHIGDDHVGQSTRYDITLIGPNFELMHHQVGWAGTQQTIWVGVPFAPIGIICDFNNNWLDGRTQKNMMLTTTSQQNFANFTAKPTAITDSVFVSVENHLVGPYDDPLIPYLTLSTKHFWTINRYDFGEANVEGWFDYSKTNDGDIIQTQNDSATLLYRKDASEPWHEIAYTLYSGSNWKQGRFILENFPSGEYVLAAWNKEALDIEEFVEPKHQMQVFPNPATKQVTVSWNGTTDGKIVLCDLNGKVLRQVTFTQKEQTNFSLENLSQGCYFIECHDASGMIIERKKLIVK